jgi:hypothetical protein
MRRGSVYSLDVKFLNQSLPLNSFLLSGEIILFCARRQLKLESDLSSFREPPSGSLQPFADDDDRQRHAASR